MKGKKKTDEQLAEEINACADIIKQAAVILWTAIARQSILADDLAQQRKKRAAK